MCFPKGVRARIIPFLLKSTMGSTDGQNKHTMIYLSVITFIYVIDRLIIHNHLYLMRVSNNTRY